MHCLGCLCSYASGGWAMLLYNLGAVSASLLCFALLWDIKLSCTPLLPFMCCELLFCAGVLLCSPAEVLLGSEAQLV